MKANRISIGIMKTLCIQMAAERRRIPDLKIQKPHKRIHICKILVSGSNDLSPGTTGKSSLNIRRKKTKTRLLDKADRKVERSTGVNILFNLVYKLESLYVFL